MLEQYRNSVEIYRRSGSSSDQISLLPSLIPPSLARPEGIFPERPIHTLVCTPFPSPFPFPPPSPPLLSPLPSPTRSIPSIQPPLRNHPSDANRANHQRPRQSRPHPRTPKHQPLAHEMHPRNNVTPQRQIVHCWVRNVVGRVQTDQRGEEGPGAEGAGGEGIDWKREKKQVRKKRKMGRGVEGGNAFLGTC